MKLPRLANLPVTLKVPLTTAALMVVLGLVASQLVLSALGRVQDDRLRELARLHVEGLSVALGPFVLRKDVWEVYDTLDRARTAGDGRRLSLTVVADDSGRVLAATDPRRAPVDSVIADFATGGVAPEAVTIHGNDPIVRVLAPLVYQGRTVGQIVTEIDVTDLVAERQRVTLYLRVGNALATAVLAFGGYLAVSRMLRPVSQLARHMSGSGGAPRPIAEAEIPRGDSELSRLFLTFNAMSGAVEARAEAERRLAERERFVSLGRLSSSLAHEINNPLGGLLNATDTIRTYPERPDVVSRSADIIDRGLRHLRDVVRVILEQNRMDRAGMPLKPEDFEDLRLLFEPEAARLGQALDWSVAAPARSMQRLPATPVRQIALNLLLNASAAAGPGGRVALEVSEGPRELALVVSDSGPGFRDADLRRLMTSDPLPPGGGVGLRLVRDMVGGLGGIVRHERVADITAIRVGLPLEPA